MFENEQSGAAFAPTKSIELLVIFNQNKNIQNPKKKPDARSQALGL
jgi:hypothetical protein